MGVALRRATAAIAFAASLTAVSAISLAASSTATTTTTPTQSLPVLPTVPAGAPTFPPPPTAATVPAGATAPISIPPGYVQIVDDTGVLTVAIPLTWTDVDTAPDTHADGTFRPYIEASTNGQRFRDTLDAPGVLLVAGHHVANTAAFLDFYGIRDGCANEVIEPFDNGVLSGHIGHWTECGTAGTPELHVVAASPADGLRTVVLRVVITRPDEQRALELALATFGLVVR